ncbi:MAG: NapC/NirT family cytochrome c [Bacteroidota bacterium]|nr:NapC/NirT family cytochrome c [Bacteroidota bacterium]
MDKIKEKKRIFPSSFYNPISIFGAGLAIVSFATIIFLTFIELIQSKSPAYIGIISYIIVPIFLIFGLMLIPFGYMREKKRKKRGMPASRMSFILDLNDVEHRRAFTLFGTATIILLLFTAYGSYRTFEWTESVEFCGTTCHSVMEPEHTAYQNSPHARVKCVECHVGSGAGWYVRSKLSGAYQVYSVIANAYSKPIPTPIHNLRPAQGTCEQCHWPSHFSGEKKYVNAYFKSDEANTRWTLGLLMKIGSGTSGRVPTSGIHWSMSIANEITYVATDNQRQVVPWVKSRNKKTGEEVEYISTDTQLSSDELKILENRTMDCIDCHNRPSHIYRPPVRIVDQSLASNNIDTELPNVRTASIQAIMKPYQTTTAAMDSIPIMMDKFYREQYPVIYDQKKVLIAQAAEELKIQFQKNIFPSMKVNWKAYPNNIGHMTNQGCFRCHDGKHVSSTGKVISKDCNICHTILYQGTEPQPSSLSVQGLDFQHPEDIGDAWKEMNCIECHAN